MTLITPPGNIKYYKIILRSGTCKIAYIILEKVEKFMNRL